MAEPGRPVRLGANVGKAGVAQVVENIPAKILEAQRAVAADRVAVDFRRQQVFYVSVRRNAGPDLRACQRAVERHREHQFAAIAKHSRAFAEGLGVVGNVLKDILGDDPVEAPVRVRRTRLSWATGFLTIESRAANGETWAKKRNTPGAYFDQPAIAFVKDRPEAGFINPLHMVKVE